MDKTLSYCIVIVVMIYVVELILNVVGMSGFMFPINLGRVSDGAI